MKLRKNLIISFVLILFFSISFFIALFQNKKQAESLNNWVIHTHLVIEGITNLNTLITEFEAQDQSYVITNDKDLKDLNSRRIKVTSEFEKIKILTADNEIQQRNLQLLLDVINSKIKYQVNIFNVLKKSHDDALLLLANPEERRLYAEIKSILSSMLTVEDVLLKQRSAEYKKVSEGRFLYSGGFVLLELILLTIAF